MWNIAYVYKFSKLSKRRYGVYTCCNKHILYLFNGLRHRTDGPASISYGIYSKKIINKTWFINNKLHRINKPAMIYYDKFYDIIYKHYLNNVETKKRMFSKLLNKFLYFR